VRPSIADCEQVCVACTGLVSTQSRHRLQRGFGLALCCSVGQRGLPVWGSTAPLTGAPVFGSVAVPMASAMQRSADIAGRLVRGLDEVGSGEEAEVGSFASICGADCRPASLLAAGATDSTGAGGDCAHAALNMAMASPKVVVFIAKTPSRPHSQNRSNSRTIHVRPYFSGYQWVEM
jgi:hypothetical protein